MTATTHILFPFDFSKQSREVVPYVRAMATVLQSKVTLFSVAPPVWELPPDNMPPIVGHDSNDDRLALQAHLDRSLTAELADVAVERIAAAGDPALRITAFAHANGVHLIMMPTHGLGPFRTLLMGSVTSKVLHDATCPVWTAAHAETQTSPTLPRKVLCAIDLTPKTAALLQFVSGFCKDIGASVTFVHVVGPVTDFPSLARERALQDQFRETSRQRIATLLRSAGIEAPLVVTVGEIVDTVTEEARHEQSELLILGRGSMTEPFGRLRTHAFGIIERSPCPVLSV